MKINKEVIKIHTGILRFILIIVDVMFFFVLTRYLSNKNNYIKKTKDKLNLRKYKYVIVVIIVVITTSLISILNLKQIFNDIIFFSLFGIMISLLENTKIA